MAKKTPAKRTSKPTAVSSLSPANEDAPSAARQDNPPPDCPYHKKPCVSNRSEPFFTRYYCPEPGCPYSQKVPRPQLQERLLRDRKREEDFSAR